MLMIVLKKRILRHFSNNLTHDFGLIMGGFSDLYLTLKKYFIQLNQKRMLKNNLLLLIC
jgi:hypothetical protein